MGFDARASRSLSATIEWLESECSCNDKECLKCNLYKDLYKTYNLVRNIEQRYDVARKYMPSYK